jgi:hypothetical protein
MDGFFLFFIIACSILAVLVQMSTLFVQAGRKFSWDQVKQLEAGMTREEVVRIMGKPTSIATVGGIDVFTWVWVKGVLGGRQWVRLQFRDGKLAAVPRIPTEGL